MRFLLCVPALLAFYYPQFPLCLRILLAISLPLIS
nr:MAG TPA: hypothetical protein [Caudoviricetes sp.]